MAVQTVPVPPFVDPERLDGPEVRDLVRLRLGETPPVRVAATDNGVVLLRSRGANPVEAGVAATTYATSFVDLRRRQYEADIAAAAGAIQGKIDQVESQLAAADGPQRAPLVEILQTFTRRLDDLQLDRTAHPGPQLIGVSPAEPVDDGAQRAWIVAALAATMGVGAAARPRRSR